MGHDGMRSSLPSRECIANSVELTVRGHAYDALGGGLAGCDKSLPGMMMAMVRLNVPSIFIYGGSILPGSFRGQPVTVQDMFEAVGKHSVGEMSDEDLDEIERVGVPIGRRLRRPNLPPIPWRLYPRRSGWHCLTPRELRRPTRSAIHSAPPLARR